MKTISHSCPLIQRIVVLRVSTFSVGQVGAFQPMISIECACSEEDRCVSSLDKACRRRQICDQS